MSHMHRFYVPPGTAGGTIALPADEAHHALRVARIREGDTVTLFDGCGRELQGTVKRAAKKEVLIEVLEERHTAVPEQTVTLIQAWLHQEKKIELLIRHAVAAYMNAVSEVEYAYTEAEVTSMVQAAYASGEFEATKNLFEAANESYCPLN